MNYKVMIVVLGVVFSVCLSWAQSDSTETAILDKPVVKSVVKREIIVPKDPVLAGLLSAQLPGIGQMYCRQWLKGGLFLITTVTLYGAANDFTSKADDDTLSQDERDQYKVLAGVTMVAGLVMHAWNIFDAYKTAEVHNIRMFELGGSQNIDIGLTFENKKASLFLKKSL